MLDIRVDYETIKALFKENIIENILKYHFILFNLFNPY